MNTSELTARIIELKKQKNAVILAHYYTSAEVQAVADFLGDSLALSVKARELDAPVILFAGVNFMAETAKVLCPDKKVLLPVPEAGCSLAESCGPEEFAEFKSKYPDHVVVSYVNTSVGVKALTDICCTSTNALQIVRSIPADKPIIFGPDRNLGAYIRKQTGRDNMVIWNGACTVHEDFSYNRLLELKEKYPQAKVVAHPECPARILDVADYVGSTAGILSFCGKDGSEQYIVVTEPGILTEMARCHPDKEFIPAPAEEGNCNECRYMKMVNLENILSCLEKEAPEVILDEEVRKAAEKAILNMVSVK